MENKIDGKTKIRMDFCIKHPNEIMVIKEEALPQCNECSRSQSNVDSEF